MTWTKSAKLKFINDRKKRARQMINELIKKNKEVGINITPKRAKKLKQKLVSKVSKEYFKRKESLKQTNKISKDITKLESIAQPTKRESRKLTTLKERKAKILSKTHERWALLEQSIGYTSMSEQDDRGTTGSKT